MRARAILRHACCQCNRREGVGARASTRTPTHALTHHLGLNRWRGAQPRANGYGPTGQGGRGDHLESPLRTGPGSGPSSFPEGGPAHRPYPDSDTDASRAARPHRAHPDPGRAKGDVSRAAAMWIERSSVRAAVSESSEEQVRLRVVPSDTAQSSRGVSLTRIA
jgi:hypothetical protein